MILLLSTANELYWLGRHSERLKQLQTISQSGDKCDVKTLVASYGWPISSPDARKVSSFIQTELLPAIIISIENNAQNVRGVIDQDTFELFNLVKRLQDSGSTRAATLQLHACSAAMEYQGDEVKLFWQLGKSIEQIDNALRLNIEFDEPSLKLQLLLSSLPKNTRWRELDRFCSQLVRHQESAMFQKFNQRFDQLITEGV